MPAGLPNIRQDVGETPTIFSVFSKSQQPQSQARSPPSYKDSTASSAQSGKQDYYYDQLPKYEATSPAPSKSGSGIQPPKKSKMDSLVTVLRSIHPDTRERG
ncbi:MAG: hypothetical protein M1819_007322 [Sarea resinae]|nr:MAG: hypothetical protein M1819_007322 [Sarea resinae]